MNFKKYLETASIPVSKVAKVLNVPEVTVNSWKYGHRVPTRKNMEKIIEFTGKQVQPNDFY